MRCRGLFAFGMLVFAVVACTQPGQPALLPPSAPIEVRALSVGATSLRLAWEPSTAAGIVGYRVYRSLASGTSEQIASEANRQTLTIQETSLQQSGLEPATRYYFVVAAVDAEGNERRSEVIAVVTGLEDHTAPDPSPGPVNPDPANPGPVNPSPANPDPANPGPANPGPGKTPTDGKPPGGEGDACACLSWRVAPSAAPNPVSETQAVVLSGKLYAFGGYYSNYAPRKDAFVYDPAAGADGTWTRLASLPPFHDRSPDGGVTHAGIATDGHDIFLASGYALGASGKGQIFNSAYVWRYNVASDGYTRMPDLPDARAAGQLEYLAGNLHYFGGTFRTGSQRTAVDTGDHYVLDYAAYLKGAAVTWTRAAPLPNPRHHMGSAVLDGNIYAVGGQHGHDALLTTQASLHAYDPKTDSWTELQPLALARGHISNATFTVDGKLIVLGGEIAFNAGVADVSAYDPKTDSWTELSPLPEARHSGIGGAIAGELFYATGTRRGFSDTVYRGSWQP